MQTRLSELRQKEVINVRDGCRLGYICDLILDLPDGCVRALVVPGPCKWLGLAGRDGEYVIDWKSICKVGDDAILVEVDREKIRAPRPKKPLLG